MGKVAVIGAILCCLSMVACHHQSSVSETGNGEASGAQGVAAAVAPPASATGGFDGVRAFEHVRRLVELGPRPPGSEAIRRAQAYITEHLKEYGCAVEEHEFHASTPNGELPMKNIVVKIPGTDPRIIVFATHYDTVGLPNFVGADDGGSGTGTMLELARVLCSKKSQLSVWIAFFDGEEAQGNWPDRESIQWTATNSTFGSREMAASMALSGELKHVEAMILVDMIGPANLRIRRDRPKPGAEDGLGSTPWLVDLIWATAARLGYGGVFLNEDYLVGGDDHYSFLKRGVAACDIIDFDVQTVQTTFWHTPEDTLDKVDARSLAIVGHVLVEVLPELEKRMK